MKGVFLVCFLLASFLYLDLFLGTIFLPIPFEVSFVLEIILTWVAAGFLLRTVKGGKRTFLWNFLLGMVLVLLFYVIQAPLAQSETDWQANLAGIELLIAAIMIWLFWGWILLLYSGIRVIRGK